MRYTNKVHRSTHASCCTLFPIDRLLFCFVTFVNLTWHYQAVCSANPYGGMCVSDVTYQCAPLGLNCGGEYALLPPATVIVQSPVNSVSGYYQLNNFDNVLRSYVTLFEQMIVNNW
jgi:hypothetical protein